MFGDTICWSDYQYAYQFPSFLACYHLYSFRHFSHIDMTIKHDLEIITDYYASWVSEAILEKAC